MQFVENSVAHDIADWIYHIHVYTNMCLCAPVQMHMHATIKCKPAHYKFKGRNFSSPLLTWNVLAHCHRPSLPLNIVTVTWTVIHNMLLRIKNGILLWSCHVVLLHSPLSYSTWLCIQSMWLINNNQWGCSRLPKMLRYNKNIYSTTTGVGPMVLTGYA